MIRSVMSDDANNICDIYNYFVKNSAISFEEEVVSIDEMKARIAKTSCDYPWLVFEKDGKILAYAYVSPWKTRSAYRYTLESTIYVSPESTSSGIGTLLYERLFSELAVSHVKSVVAVIALPNDASIRLHEKIGFEKVSHYKEVGYKLGEWIDVGCWQKVL